MRASPVSETDLKELEIFSDHLTDTVVKLEDSDQHQQLAGISALYIAVQKKLPGSLLIAYQEWLHSKPRKDGVSVFSKWLQKQVVYCMDIEEVKERTKKKAKIIQSQRNTSVRKQQFTTLPESPRPRVLSAMDLTKQPHARTGMKHPLQIDGKSQKGMNFVIVA